MIRCTKCVLPDTFPHISFNKEGVCNFCQRFKGEKKIQEDKGQYLAKFKELIKTVRGKSEYDCSLSYSGGKDSTYTLYLLKEVFKLRVLVLVLDNGFLPEQTFKNIETITRKLNVEHQIVKPDFEVLKEIFRHAVYNPMYSAKTLERASTICTSCIGLVKFIFLKIALKMKIPIMAWGWSPGQAPLRSSIMKINPELFKATQELLRKPMKEIAGDAVDEFFLTEEQFKKKDDFPFNVSPLAFMDYNEEKIRETIEKLGWVAPADVDHNSTNCLLNSFSNKIHIERYGFHPYVFEIAEMVRSGVMLREEGLKKITNIGAEDTIEYAKQKLGIKQVKF